MRKCIDTLEASYAGLIAIEDEQSLEYEIYRNSLVKAFELTLEQSAKVLKKILIPYFATKRQADQLTFKDIFRYSSKYGYLDCEHVERWFSYRNNRNSTTHDYGRDFAEETVDLALQLIADARHLVEVLQ